MDVDVLSLSYMSVFDSGKVLEELSRSLNELKALVESVEAKYGEALQQPNVSGPAMSPNRAGLIV